MTELCRVWANLAADPENPAAVAAARARLVELAAHMGTCDVCAVVGEAMPFPERVFAVLGEENLEHLNLSPEELAEIRALDVLSANDPGAIPQAVEFLLAGLPTSLGTPAGNPLQVFDSIDAVNQLVRSTAGRIPQAKIEISSAGVRINGASVSSRATVIAEIARVAGVSDKLAQSLWSWQLQASEYCPTLYPDLVVTNAANGVFEVAVEKASGTRDLVVRWQVRHPVRSKNELLYVLAELKEAVVAGTRLLAGLTPVAAEKELGRLVPEIARQNAQIAAMVDGVDGDEPQEESDSPRVRPTGMPAALGQLIKAEQHKQRCLREIANAPAATAKLRAFAAKTQAVAGRNVIELQKLVKV